MPIRKCADYLESNLHSLIGRWESTAGFLPLSKNTPVLFGASIHFSTAGSRNLKWGGGGGGGGGAKKGILVEKGGAPPCTPPPPPPGSS